MVRRYQGCLSSLDSRSQRLLSLRSGLHSAPRSAASVARILHISAGREQLLEQMSLLSLQDAGQRHGCSGASTSTSSGSAPVVPAADVVGPVDDGRRHRPPAWSSAAGATTAAHGQSSAVPSSSSSQPRSAGHRSDCPDDRDLPGRQHEHGGA